MILFRLELKKLLHCPALWGLFAVFLLYDGVIVWQSVGRQKEKIAEQYRILQETDFTVPGEEAARSLAVSDNYRESEYGRFILNYKGIYESFNFEEVSPEARPEEWSAFQNRLMDRSAAMASRVRQIRESGEDQNVFYPETIYRIYDSLFRNLFRSILLEIMILTVFTFLYLMDYERASGTEDIAFLGQKGRKLWAVKGAAALCVSLLYAALLLGLSLPLFFVFVPMKELWQTPISSFMMTEWTADGDIMPLISLAPLSLTAAMHLRFALLLLFILLTALFSAAFWLFLHSSFRAVILYGAGFLVLLVLPYFLPETESAGILTELAYLTPVRLWLDSGKWFVFRNLITAYNGNELFGVSLWLLTASILCLISVRRFIKRDCQ
ncbi:MAG: hypothetical protein IJK77_07635 [Lachnospiraceae bacterium]|nr:hypothetical protein [Lachnospiraceae bacterium]